jgi:hypothetical protein
MKPKATANLAELFRALNKPPRRLVIHGDGTISLRNLVGRKHHRWRHGLTEISERDFKRLLPEEQTRIRSLEKRLGRKLVVADYQWEPGVEA